MNTAKRIEYKTEENRSIVILKKNRNDGEMITVSVDNGKGRDSITFFKNREDNTFYLNSYIGDVNDRLGMRIYSSIKKITGEGFNSISKEGIEKFTRHFVCMYGVWINKDLSKTLERVRTI